MREGTASSGSGVKESRMGRQMSGEGRIEGEWGRCSWKFRFPRQEARSFAETKENGGLQSQTAVRKKGEQPRGTQEESRKDPPKAGKDILWVPNQWVLIGVQQNSEASMCG